MQLNTPFSMIIFGATGDLARFKLIPALLDLYHKKQLPEDFSLFGFARRDLSDGEFHKLYGHLKSKKQWDKFARHYHYQQGTFEDNAGYEAVILKLQEIDKKYATPLPRLFYLATPPEYYETILGKLKSTNLTKNPKGSTMKQSLAKVIIEKPFGKNLKQAKELDLKLADIFAEDQIFRVDHYLGKEVVQNIIAFRFANGIFDPVWNAKHLDHIQITISERNGVNGRGQFFDGVGNLRDVAQNHLLQLVTAVAMEQPRSFTKEAVRDARAKAMHAIRTIPAANITESVIRGQYASYRTEDDVDRDSNTETYVAMKLYIDTPRLTDIPFYVRAGKKMAEDFVEISLVFKQTCHLLFREYGCPEIGNVLTFRIQPDEGIHLRTIVKQPGTSLSLVPVNMHFTYRDAFKEKATDAYEKILLDIFSGDQILFNRSDELEYSWKWITEILEGWQKKKSKVLPYADNSWGPEAADALLKRDGRNWLQI